MTELADFLRARYAEQRVAVIQYRDGHDGPCLNYPDQDPEHYDEFDSCYRHNEVAQATPYRDAAFGLADIDAKVAVVDAYVEADEIMDRLNCPDGRDIGRAEGLEESVQRLALPFVGHPDYEAEWAPTD